MSSSSIVRIFLLLLHILAAAAASALANGLLGGPLGLGGLGEGRERVGFSKNLFKSNLKIILKIILKNQFKNVNKKGRFLACVFSYVFFGPF